MTLDEFLIDKRIVDRNIKNGKVDVAQYQAVLAALPDLSHRLWRRPDAEPAVSAPVESDAARTNPNRQEPSAVPQFQPTPLG
jgi:hypothetical protein